MTKVFFLRIVLATGLLATAAARATAQDLEGALRTQLAAAEGLPVQQLFELGERLLDHAPENTEAFRNALMPAAQAGGSKTRLAAAVALRGLVEGDAFGKDLLTLAEPLAADADEGVRAAAMSLLSDDKHFNTRVLPDVRKLVEKNCADELVPPTVRVEAALALYSVGHSEQKLAAKAVLEQFLSSSDRALQVRGALALAQINAHGGKTWQVLREIQDEPTPDGRTARLFVQREEDRRVFEDRLRDLNKALSQTPAQAASPAADNPYKLLDELRSRIKFMHVRGAEVTDKELIEYAAKGMLAGLDPHSTFFTSDEFKRFFFDLDREYGGIGAFVNFDQDNDFSIIRPIYSGPAYRAGLLSGDKILEVDGWETAGHTSDEIIKHLKGRPGTDVSLKYFRPGFQEPQELTIQRQQIAVPAVNWTVVPGDIGYVELINFSANISQELQVALDDLLKKNVKGLVLDLRNNTGGYLNQARDVCEKFLPADKLVVYTEGPAEDRRNYKTRAGRKVTDLPLAVLTNNFSASASEITAGALQDHGRAVIIGERSYGKGTVQNPMELESDPPEDFTDLNGDHAWQDGEPYTDRNHNGQYDPGAHIKLTVAKYHLPSGRCPHREYDKEGRIVDPTWGVIPDKKLLLLENKPEDAWKNSAVLALLKKAAFRDYVKSHLPGNEALFQKLAEGDDGDTSRYPEFDAWYESLDTKLTKDDVRRWLRYEVRDRISDLRGAVYPGNRALGDPQEDAQLQEAVRTLLGKTGIDIRTIAAYQHVLKIGFEDKDEHKTVAK